VTLLKANFPAARREGDQIVIQAKQGDTVRTPAVKTEVTARFDQGGKAPGRRSSPQPL
jgi:hypothetical protein